MLKERYVQRTNARGSAKKKLKGERKGAHLRTTPHGRGLLLELLLRGSIFPDRNFEKSVQF